MPESWPDSWPDSWRALRDTDRDLAMCLLFSPAAGRAALADRLSLALEAELSLRIASEPMLAAIRLQWWVEAIEAGRHESVPLMRRLLRHLEAGDLRQDDLLAQLAIWQDRLADDTIPAGTCWQGFFEMMAGTQSARDSAARDSAARDSAARDSPARDAAAGDAAGRVGAALQDHERAAQLDDATVASLQTPQCRWIWMAGMLARYRLSGGYREDDALLVWRMLGWRFGIRLPSPSSSP